MMTYCFASMDKSLSSEEERREFIDEQLCGIFESYHYQCVSSSLCNDEWTKCGESCLHGPVNIATNSNRIAL